MRVSKGLNYLFAVILGAVVILKLLGLYTDYLWMGSVGQAAVFTKLLGTRVLLGVIAGLLFFLWVWLNLRLARRPVLADVPFIGKRLLPEEERAQIEEYADRALLIFALAGGVLAGLYASARWLEYLQFAHAVDFGTTDRIPGLGRDVGFYVFKLNFVQYLWRSCFYGVIIAFVLSILVHLYQEGIRIVGNTVHALPRARAHCLSLLALALFLKTYGYRLTQYLLVHSQRGGFFSGASYADAHAKFPILYLMMVLTCVTGIIMLLAIRQRGFKLVGWAMAILVVVSFLAGTAYPNAIQRLVVQPTQLQKEQPYIERNIAATNEAFGLSDLIETEFPGAGEITAEVVAANPETISNIRLWDHRPLETTYDQIQALRAYYKFADVDVDRYWINGEYRQVMLAARQIDYAKLREPSWVNTYLSYTHGYGLCMSPVTEITEEGQPRLWISDLPVDSIAESLKVQQPALYYMTSSHPRLIELIAPPEAPPIAPATPPTPEGPEGPAAAPAPQSVQRVKQTKFVIVNTTNPELHYPSTAEEGGEANVTTHYAGAGGVSLKSWFTRLAFAARFMDIQILLTQYTTPDSRILINRYVPERLAAIAPFLVYDPDPYLTVINGQLQWICDSYTFSRMYPYSTRKAEIGNINYLRNAVKVVCDGYDGIPTFYVVDSVDPLTQCYRNIFPSLFTDGEQMPEETRDHLRYPQLLFRVQAETFAIYHMKDPKTFFHREDSWAIPPEMYSERRRPMEAYYVIMKLPGEEREEFIQMLPLALEGREDKNLVAWMAARCDAPNYGELLVYRFTKGSWSKGPMQIESLIDQDPDISEKLSLWGQKGSRVIRGNTLVIPIEDSLLYIEPVYLESTESPLPQLKQVVVSSGGFLIMAPTLDAALARLFGRAAGVAPARVQPTAAGAPAAPELPAELRPIKDLIQKALDLGAEARQRLGAGDLAGYQAKQDEQEQILEQIDAATE